MTESSPEPRDPWAPPERPAVDLGKAQGAHGAPGVSVPPSVHDQPTLAGMPGDQLPPSAQHPAPAPTPASTTMPMTGPPASAAYGYPAQPQQNYGYPGDAGYPGYSGYPGYPAPGAYPPYGAQRNNGFGIAGLVLGILSVVGCVTSFIAVALGIGAVVFGALGKGKATRGEADNGGMALAGIILGAVGIVLGGLMLAIIFGSFMDQGPIDDSPYDSPYDNSRVHEKT
ncbi:DUF4190 domain-containing protein [Streptomyces sp. NPDC054849]